jgi:putative transposase
MGEADRKRLRQIEEQNRKLKRLVADLGLEKKMLQVVLARRF